MEAVMVDGSVDAGRIQKFRRRLTNSWLMRSYMLFKLPLGLMAGLRVAHVDDERCEVTIPYGWRSTNPFKSTYFAALSMAAEMSTGALGMILVEAAPVPVSMLVVGMKGEFVKKATGLTTFRCEAGATLREAVEKTLADGEPVVREVETVGTNQDGDVVARFTFTWSFKRKR